MTVWHVSSWSRVSLLTRLWCQRSPKVFKNRSLVARNYSFQLVVGYSWAFPWVWVPSLAWFVNSVATTPLAPHGRFHMPATRAVLKLEIRSYTQKGLFSSSLCRVERKTSKKVCFTDGFTSASDQLTGTRNDQVKQLRKNYQGIRRKRRRNRLRSKKQWIKYT